MKIEECPSLLNISTRYLSHVRVDVDNGATYRPSHQRAGFASDVTRVPRESHSRTRVSAWQSQYITDRLGSWKVVVLVHTYS